MSKQTIKLSGLTCSACERLIEKRLGSLPEVTKVEVSLKNSTATIESVREIEALEIKQKLAGTPYAIA